eukprot:13876507-Ditylum_brightwellii.AAC.1
MSHENELKIDSKLLHTQIQLNQTSLFHGMLSKSWTDTQDTHLWEKNFGLPIAMELNGCSK